VDVLSHKLVNRVYRQAGGDGAVLVRLSSGVVHGVVAVGVCELGDPFGCGLARRCLETGLVVDGTRADGGEYWRARAIVEGLAVPVVSELGVVQGALVLYATRSGAFTAEARDRAQVLATALSGLLERSDDFEALEAAREPRFETFMKAVPALAWIKDDQGRYAWVNEALERAFGLAPGGLIGKTDAWYLPPDVAHSVRQNDERVQRDRVVLHTTEFVQGPHEAPREWWVTKFPMVRHDGVVLVGGIAQDRSELRLAERNAKSLAERLQQTEVDLRQVVESLADPVLIHRGGVIAYANRAAAAMLGAPAPAALLGVELESLGHPDDRQKPLFGRQALEPDRKLTGERRLRRADGTYALVDLVANPIAWGGEGAEVAVMRDVTTRKANEAQAQLSARLIALGTLSAGVAHEINNPLSYVMSNLALVSEALASGGPLTDALRAELTLEAGDAMSGADRIRRIVAGLRTVGHGGALTPRTPLSLEAVLRTAIDLAGVEIRHRARLVETYEPAPQVLADEAQLVQVFVNLLTNAAQAIEPGAVERHAVTVRCFTDPEGHAVAEVGDDGQGIAPEHLPRIFDPFFTTKQVNEGMGLGLSMTHGIITALGGSVTVQSQRGVGTVFRVALPAAVARPVAAPEATPAVPRKRVLVVDDDKMLARSLQRLLAREHDVEVALEAQAALAREDLPSFDLILCDVMMPGLDGPAFHEALRARHPELASRVVFMSGGIFAPEVRVSLDRLNRPMLEKPVLPADLRRVLAQLGQ
jgi:PAS domain S-box-containing protein